MFAMMVRNETASTLVVPDAQVGKATLEPGTYGVVRLQGTRDDPAFWSLVARGLISVKPARRAA